eukprot:gb/GEZN01007127.1/.p1 GENE.gb/GEZN01007127.1/~~gb/GEZN01007127.1/.p1  ORF type:complete len:310 (-),score=23.38 gb/GEZN01007127.1/:518-1447(-)
MLSTRWLGGGKPKIMEKCTWREDDSEKVNFAQKLDVKVKVFCGGMVFCGGGTDWDYSGEEIEEISEETEEISEETEQSTNRSSSSGESSDSDESARDSDCDDSEEEAYEEMAEKLSRTYSSHAGKVLVNDITVIHQPATSHHKVDGVAVIEPAESQQPRPSFSNQGEKQSNFSILGVSRSFRRVNIEGPTMMHNSVEHSDCLVYMNYDYSAVYFEQGTFVCPVSIDHFIGSLTRPYRGRGSSAPTKTKDCGWMMSLFFRHFQPINLVISDRDDATEWLAALHWLYFRRLRGQQRRYRTNGLKTLQAILE